MKILIVSVFLLVSQYVFCQNYIAHWSIDDEYGVKIYEVEQSNDSLRFYSIGMVSPKHIADYRYSFPLPGITAYYRLKIVSDEVRFTKPVFVKADFVVNISSNKVFINSPRTQQANMSINDITGRLLEKKSFLIIKGDNEFSYTSPVSKGVYILSIASDGIFYTKKIISQ